MNGSSTVSLKLFRNIDCLQCSFDTVHGVSGQYIKHGCYNPFLNHKVLRAGKCLEEMIINCIVRGRPVREFSTGTSNQQFKDLFQPEPNQLPASANTELEPSTNCWFYQQLVGKTSNIFAFFSRNRNQSGKV